MRTRNGWLTLLLTAGMALAPAMVLGQEVPRADPIYPLPLYHDRPETGGFFVYGEFMYYHQTNPLHGELLTTRGFVDTTGGLQGGDPPGTFFGTGIPALRANDAGGPNTWVPGFKLGLGYRFSDALEVDLSYMRLFNARYVGGATLAATTTQLDPQLANTFLFSPVFNFSPAFAGEAFKVNGQGPFEIYGIWNGATEETIRFDQRLDKWDLRFRMPIAETDPSVFDDCDMGGRCYGLAGFQRYWLWEQFQWRVVGRDINGNAGPGDVAIYTNTLSQPMYGPYCGCGSECWLGKCCAVSLDVTGSVLLDFVRTIDDYERGDFSTESKRAARNYSIVPVADAAANFWIYPIEGVELRVGYDFTSFFNTIYSPNPVSFNFASPDPPYQHRAIRLLDGFNMGISLIF